MRCRGVGGIGRRAKFAIAGRQREQRVVGDEDADIGVVG